MRVIVPAGLTATASSDCVTSDYVTGYANAMKAAEGVTGEGVFTIWTLTSPASAEECVLNVGIRIANL